MNIIILQHEDSTPPGSVITWAHKHSFPVSVINCQEGKFPDPQSFDLLVILGGGMNIDQEDIHPWLKEEKKFIRAAVHGGKKILGLCLGAQLLAEIMGSKVFKADLWEAGWHDILVCESNETLKVFQFHGYQFLTPKDAAVIAQSPACPHQGFRFKNQILAFQFHPEATVPWTHHCAVSKNKPLSGLYVQTPEEIYAGDHYQPKMQQWFFLELDRFFSENHEMGNY